MIAVLWFFLLGVLLSEYVQLISDRGTFIGSLFGRSRCDSCQTPLPWWALLPVFGRLLTKSRCFYCNKKISRRYFWFEILFISGWGAVLAGLYAYNMVETPFLAATLLLYSTTALIMYEDYKNYSIPVSWLVSWSIMFAGMWYLYFTGPVYFVDAGLILTVLLFSLAFVLLRKRYKLKQVGDLFGAADVIVLLLFALFLGFQKTTWILLLSLVGAFAFLLLEKRLKQGQQIPLLTVMIPWGVIALLFL
ncbi:MAG: prepilin peptidase [Candidatus Dojkabacteria bacterium]|nr:MAG: prepilin peptidase [Candidatus Dojkabacteria bacterium]